MGSDGPGRKPTVTDDEILTVFVESKDPVLMADEVAESLSIGRRAVYNRLKSLEKKGVLKSKKAGARSTVWWYPGYTATQNE